VTLRVRFEADGPVTEWTTGLAASAVGKPLTTPPAKDGLSRRIGVIRGASVCTETGDLLLDIDVNLSIELDLKANVVHQVQALTHWAATV
jgi:hypothetical protein